LATQSACPEVGVQITAQRDRGVRRVPRAIHLPPELELLFEMFFKRQSVLPQTFLLHGHGHNLEGTFQTVFVNLGELHLDVEKPLPYERDFLHLASIAQVL